MNAVSALLMALGLLNMARVDFDKPSFQQCVDAADFVVQAEFIKISDIDERLGASLQEDNPFPDSLQFAMAEFVTQCCIKGKDFPDSVSLPVLVRRQDGAPIPGNVSWELVLVKGNISVRAPDRAGSVACSYILCVKEKEAEQGVDTRGATFELVSSGLYQPQSVRVCIELF